MIGYSKEVADRVLRILQAGGQLDQDELRDVMNKQNGKSPEVLSSLIHNGFDEEVIQTILSRAYALRRKSVTPETIDKEILKSLPIKFIKKEGILPLAKEGRFLRVGAVDPTKATLGGQIKALTNFNVEFFIIKLSDFEACLETEDIKNLQTETESAKDKRGDKPVVAPRRRTPRWNVEDASLVAAFCDDMLQASVDLDVSDIHIEPFRDTARIRFRINGVLEIMDSYSNYLFHNYSAVTTRLKILADCDISEKRVPQDGAITFKTKDGEIVIAIGNEKIFKHFCEIINDTSIGKDKRFNSNDNRNKNIKELRLRIEKNLSKEKSNFWLKKFQKEKIPSARITTIREVLENKQVISREIILEYIDNNLDSMRVTSSPFKFNFIKEKSKINLAPELNENEDEILKFLGIN